MRQCDECSARYDDSIDVCPIDGARVSSVDVLVGRVIDGKYRIDDAIGSGAMGTVYRATQLNLDRTVALKIVRGEIASNPKSAERFKREALAIARLKHPHIVTIYDFGVTLELGAYLVMEYLEGHSLMNEIRNRTKLPVSLASMLMRQVCSAVHAAHSSGVIHRDLKPQNIHLEQAPDGAVAKVLDFGVAKLQGSSDSSDVTALTASGAMLGTPLYISPEQCSDLPLDARSDIYSLGCVFFEMLTGRPPFTGPSVASVLVKQMREHPKPPSHFAPEVPGELDTVVLKSLAKLPGERYQTAADFGYALAPFEERQGGRTTTEIITSVERTHDPIRASAGFGPVVLTAPTNIPQQVTSFVGREAQLAELDETLASTRLVTLVGPGGVGKTRLAIEAANRVVRDHPDGAWFVDLGSVSAPNEVPGAVAHAAGLQIVAGQTMRQTFEEQLRGRRFLFVLDSCEHVAEACARLVEDLLHVSPGARVLATSREALGIVGETVWQVPTLDLPAWRPGEAVESLALAESVRLLVDRVRLNKPGFKVTQGNAETVAELVRQLDGLPLAIELAAARAKVLTVEQILAKMDDRFHLLAGGGRTTALRHRTLRATLDWSHDMLVGRERAMLRRLSVFAGGWTLVAAEAVCGYDPIENLDGLDLLTRLVDRSLVAVEERAGEARYRMLESTRQYGHERLREAGEEDEMLRRHCEYFLVVAEEARASAMARREHDWLTRLDLEADNLRVALETAIRRERDARSALRLACLLGSYWEVRGLFGEGLDRLEEAIALAEGAESVEPGLLARANYWAGDLAVELAEYDRAREFLERAASLAQSVGDERRRVQALQRLCDVETHTGGADRAAALNQEALEIYRRLGDGAGVARTVYTLGVLAMDRAEYSEAVTWLEESLMLNRSLGQQRAIAFSLHNLGEVFARQGHYEHAERALGEALELAESLGHRRLAALTLGVIGQVAVGRGELDRAEALFREALSALRDVGDRFGVSHVLEGYAGLAAARGHGERALRLAGAAERVREQINAPLSPAERELVERIVAAVRASLDEHDCARARAAGRAMTLEQAIDYALLDA